MRTEGIDLEHGGQPLLDLRFADDILAFATSSQQAAYLLDELVVALADVGLILNQDKTKLITTHVQPPTTITTPGGLSVAVVDRDGCHKWLGCILSGNNSGSHRLALEYHLKTAGHVRSGRFRAQALKHNMYTAAIYMRQKLTNGAKCEFHTTSSNSLHDPRFAYLQYA